MTMNVRGLVKSHCDLRHTIATLSREMTAQSELLHFLPRLAREWDCCPFCEGCSPAPRLRAAMSAARPWLDSLELQL
eukprot:970345-Pelagomonas_calceolata.AAC.1